MATKISYLPLLLCTVLSASSNAAVPTADSKNQTDLTAVFSGIEKDCGGSNPSLQNAMGWLSTRTGKPPLVDKAPGGFRAAIGGGTVAVKNGGDAWTLFVSTPNASYRGAKLFGVERVSGNNNGISSLSLIFAEGPAVVTKALGKIKVPKADPDAIVEPVVPQLFTEKGTSRAVLMCDFST